MLKLNLYKKRGNSNQQIDIENVHNGIIKISANQYRIVLQTSSINFELRSEEEQDAIIDTYESFLNSIGFAIQILIRTREIDMDSYLLKLENQINTEKLIIYKQQLESYRRFISSLISANKILSRQFYIVIAYETDKHQEISVINDQLTLRSDIISKNLARLGLSCRQLTSIEVVDLFYSFYNPHTAKSQPLSDKVLKVVNAEFITKADK
jgi:hypothetical protein